MRLALVAAAALLPAVAAAQTTVYSQNFESGSAGPAWSGAGSVQSTQGLSAFGFGAQHLKNDGTQPSILTLGALAAHSSMTLSFDLAMWDSIDLGDTFAVIVDGTPLYSGTFGNYFPPSGHCEGPGTPITAPFSSFSSPDYGYSSSYHDCAQAVSFTFAHSAPTAVFSFAYPNSQSAPDESFGVDNVLVTTDATTATPEPATWASLGTGLLAIAAFRRRRQSTSNSRAASRS